MTISIILFGLISIMLYGCFAKPVSEMDGLTRDVLKSEQGVQINVTPMPKDKCK